MDRRVAKAVFNVEHSKCEKSPRGKKSGDAEEFSNHHHPLQFAQRFAYAGLSDRVLLGSSGNGKVTVYVDGDGIDEHLGQIDQRGPQAYVTDHLGSVLNTPVTGGTPGRGLGPGAHTAGDPAFAEHTARNVRIRRPVF